MPFEKTKRDIVAEHQQICDAALARDADAACDLLVKHLTVTAKLIFDGAAQAEDPEREREMAG